MNKKNHKKWAKFHLHPQIQRISFIAPIFTKPSHRITLDLKPPYPKFHKNLPANIKKTEPIFIYACKETVVVVAETIITKSTLA